MPMLRSQFREMLPAGTDGTGELLSIEEAERERFGPWRAWARRHPARRLPRRSDETLEDLTRLVVVKGKVRTTAATAVDCAASRVLPIQSRRLSRAWRA